MQGGSSECAHGPQGTPLRLSDVPLWTDLNRSIALFNERTQFSSKGDLAQG